MTPDWKEISKYISFLLLFGVIVFNLAQGNSIGSALFRGVVVFLVFRIIEILISGIITRILHENEVSRINELSDDEDEEEDFDSDMSAGETGESR
ncbi:hypothetical protein ACFLQJ_03065 [Calditrichota bacterium]